MARANPVLGVGFNAYNPSYDAYDDSQGEYGTGRSVHSSFFGILAELGYVGFILYITILISAFRSCHCVRKLAAKAVVPRELGQAGTAFEASLTAFMIGGSFVPSQYSEMLWHFIGLTIVLQQLADWHVGQRREGHVLETTAATSVQPLIPQ
jgi:O-antigen ligase